jgi:hypothetical protein
MNGRPWTDAERDRLLALKDSGMGNVAIARMLGRSATSVGTQLYALRHPDRAAAIQAAYRERHGDRVRERQAERYRADRPRLVAAHRDYYATNRDKVLARQAERRCAEAEHVRQIRRASHARNQERHAAAQRCRNAVAKARAGDARRLGTLAGLAPGEAAYWLPRLPPGCVARALVAKLRAIAALQDELRPEVRRILTGEPTGRGHGDFGVVVPFGRDTG